MVDAMSNRAHKNESYTVAKEFYHCCFSCMTITKFEKGQKIMAKDSATSGGWRYMKCPKCGRWDYNLNVDISWPSYVQSFPYAFMEEYYLA
jgi:hypothetical protein